MARRERGEGSEDEKDRISEYVAAKRALSFLIVAATGGGIGGLLLWLYPFAMNSEPLQTGRMLASVFVGAVAAILGTCFLYFPQLRSFLPMSKKDRRAPQALDWVLVGHMIGVSIICGFVPSPILDMAKAKQAEIIRKQAERDLNATIKSADNISAGQDGTPTSRDAAQVAVSLVEGAKRTENKALKAKATDATLKLVNRMKDIGSAPESVRALSAVGQAAIQSGTEPVQMATMRSLTEVAAQSQEPETVRQTSEAVEQLAMTAHQTGNDRLNIALRFERANVLMKACEAKNPGCESGKASLLATAEDDLRKAQTYWTATGDTQQAKKAEALIKELAVLRPTVEPKEDKPTKK